MKEVSTKDKLVVFLYLLMRDDMAAGRVEELVREAERGVNQSQIFKEVDDIPVYSSLGAVRLTNGYLGNYAEELTERLKNK